jgi:hypothetical protein
MSRPQTVLALSSYPENTNRVFEDYCNGIKANSERYFYIDYMRRYAAAGWRALRQEILGLIAREGVDTVFFVLWSSDMSFDLDFIEELSGEVQIVMNFFDTEYFFPSVDRYYAQVADLVILPDHLARFGYEHLGIPAHTSFALFDKEHYRRLDRPKDIDVSFIGNVLQADRKDYIQFLKDNGIAIQTYGVGSDNGFVSFEEMVEVFNRSRINLNFTSTSNSSSYVVKVPSINQRIRQSKGRPIEIALCGGFILSQNAPGIEHMFEPGHEIEIFHDKQQLLDLIRQRLDAPEETQAMADAAHAKAQRQYDVVAGFRTIFDKLEAGTRKAELPVYRDADFVRGFAAYRFYYMAIFLLSGRFGLVGQEIALVWKSRTLPLGQAYFSAIKGLTFHFRTNPRVSGTLKRLRDTLRLKAKY